jgi:ferric-dicitrate binding protein FerR (iron transport regulator)
MMMTDTGKAGILMFCLALAFLAEIPNLAPTPAGAQEQVGLLTVIGMVKVNGKPAATGDIVVSGSEVQTAKGSSADVNLGKLGRVEALPSTTMKLRYDETITTHTPASVAILLGDGSVRASTREEIRFNVESSMTLTRPSSQTEQSVFTVDTTCGNTSVSVAKGKVEVRVGNSVKQIATGGQDTAGPARSGCTPPHNP